MFYNVGRFAACLRETSIVLKIAAAQQPIYADEKGTLNNV